MTAGKLASVKPTSATNTLLYRCPINKSASTVLFATNQDGSTADTYSVVLRDYDQYLDLALIGDTGDLNYRKGNVVTTYLLEVAPGVVKSSLSANNLVALDNNAATFRYHDVFIDKSIKNIDVKSDSVGTINLSIAPTGGTLESGDILTGEFGLEAYVYEYVTLTNSITAGIPNLTSSATSVYLSNIVTILAGDYLAIPNPGTGLISYEVTTVGTITSGTHTAVLTRGVLGTTPSEHLSGASSSILRPTATTTTLSAAITDIAATTISVTSAAGMTIGNYLRIGTELLAITSIDANNISVTRGDFSTTAATALNGATVTYVSSEGRLNINYFDSEEDLTVGAVTTTISNYTSTQNPFSPLSRFVFDTNLDGVYEAPTTISLDIDRTYRFVQNDASNTGHSLRFVLTGDDEEYTTGIIVIGTAGNAGAYTQISVSSLTSATLSVTDLDDTDYSLPAQIDVDPTYTKIYVYDIDGTISSGDSFSTSTGTNTIDVVYEGPYGYVQDFDVSGFIKVSLGLNSSVFQSYTTTITGSDESISIVVGSATGLIPGMYVTGTGIAANARILSIDGTTITLDTANDGAVSGSGIFTHVFYDSPRTPGAVRKLLTVDDFSVIGDIVDLGDVIYSSVDIAASTTHKNSSIVIGPGQSLVVECGNGDVSFNLNGFEDNTADFTVQSYNRV